LARRSAGGFSEERVSEEKIVLDTTYLLPLTGIRVRGISDGVVECIIDKYEAYYPAAMLAELEAVLLREAARRGFAGVPREAVEALNTIVYSGRIRLLMPRGEELEIMSTLHREGWRDIFDSILYAAGSTLNARILTLDTSFKRFLEKIGMPYEHLVTHGDLDRCK
jgi:predicted nucleic acid-binding protein